MFEYDERMLLYKFNPFKWCEVTSAKRKLARKNHQKREADKTTFHGTNVSLCVGSDKRGSGPNARVVTMAVAYKYYSEEISVSEKRVIDALELINEGEVDHKTVINCSWSLRMHPKSGIKMKNLFTELHNKGAHIVTSAGNIGVSQFIIF